jgi:phospholipid/cholesterol/gamma-HCH transport system substrate-binding protein
MSSGIGRRRHPYKLYGVALLAVVAGLVTLSVLAYQQTFTSFAHVRVHVDRAALQLLPGSDVKVRGIVVGSVSDITSDGRGADLLLKLDPDRARTLPRNVTVRMLPKTLFGEKYVDLVLPQRPSTARLGDGSVIAADRTRSTLEIDQALNDLLPLLRTVPPVELNNTLSAVATALSGRGEQLGETVEQLDRYLRRFNPHLPQLAHDMAALGGVTRTYTEAAGPLLDMLGNLATTSHTVVDQQGRLAELLASVTGASDATRDLLARNADGLVTVNRVNRDVIRLLARYSPEYPCFVKGYYNLIPRIHDAVGRQPEISHSAHVVVEFVPAFPTYQHPIDLPEFNDRRGPSCYGLPHPPHSLPVIRYKDGTEDDPRFDAQGGSARGSTRARDDGRSTVSPAAYGPATRAGGTSPVTALDTILGPMLGIASYDVPDVAELLWGPIARGSGVVLR